MSGLGNTRFTHISLRIPENLRHQLDGIARGQHIPLNALATRILAKCVEFDRIVEHERSIVLDRQVFLRFIDETPLDQLEILGRTLGPRLVKQTFEFFDVEPTVKNLVSHYFEPMGAYSGRYQVNITGSGSNFKLILEHDFGSKWSAFLVEHTKGVFKSVLGTEPLIESSDSLVKVTFQSDSDYLLR